MRRTLPIVMLVALVAAGCGSSNDGGTKTTTKTTTTSQSPAASLTKREFITKADAACQRFNQRIQAIPQTAKNPKETAALYRRVVTEAQSFYRSFAALPEPRPDTALLTRYRADLRESIGITKQVADAVAKKDTKKVAQLTASAKKLQLDRRKIAKRYGFHFCGVAQ
jgi:hypothetical protein